MNIQLDFRSDIPVTNQIVEQIQQQLVSGHLKPGDQLPTVRAMALELRVNFNTVARAYRILDEEGVISTQQGRGTFILEQPPPDVSNRLKHESLTALTRQYINQAERLGFEQKDILDAIQAYYKEK